MKTKGMVFTIVASTIMNLTPVLAAGPSQAPEIVRTKSAKLSMLPVKHSKTNTDDCVYFYDQCLLPLERKAVEFNDFSFVIKPTEDPESPVVEVLLNEKDQKKLAQLTRKYVNHQLAIMHNGEIITAPVVKESIEGGKFWLSLKSSDTLDELIKSFSK